MSLPPSNERKTVRMSDIAKAAGVSPMTVSNSFRNPKLVSETTRQRVLEVAKTMGYVPNSMAGNLVSGRSNVVAVVTSTLRRSNFADMISGLETALAAEGYHLLISLVEEETREADALRTLIGRRVDGIVVAGELLQEESRDLIRKTGTPLVETWDLNGDALDMTVGFSEHDAAATATRELIARGLTRLGVIGIDMLEHRRLRQRVAGFHSALAEAGLTAAAEVLVNEESGYAEGAFGLNALLEQAPDLQGVFCITDILATGVLFECLRKGWTVPDRLAVMGYGDYDIGREFPPGLSTVHTPGTEIGAGAARLLIARIMGDADQPAQLDVGYHLIKRGT